MDFASIPGQESAKRALEIALAGKHSILLVSYDARASEALAAAARALDAELTIGVAGDGMAAIMASTLAMAIEVPPTSEMDYKRPLPCDTSAAIAQRIAASPAENFSEPREPARRLMRDAIAAGCFTEEQGPTIVAIARTIARLDGIADAVERIHIAEAIAYRVGAFCKLPPAALKSIAPAPLAVTTEPAVTEPTRAGNQYVLPGCARDKRRGATQMDLF